MRGLTPFAQDAVRDSWKHGGLIGVLGLDDLEDTQVLHGRQEIKLIGLTGNTFGKRNVHDEAEFYRRHGVDIA